MKLNDYIHAPDFNKLSVQYDLD